MNEPLGKRLEEGPDASALDRLWRERMRRKERRPRRPWPVVLAAVAVAVLALIVLWPRAPGPLAFVAGGMSGTTATTPERFAFDDGSVVTLDVGTRFAMRANDGAHFDTTLEAGRVHLSVTPGGPRRWTIDCGIATVVVVGTELAIARDATTVDVSVSHGRVLVKSPHLEGGERYVSAGESLHVIAPLASDLGPPTRSLGPPSQPPLGPAITEPPPPGPPTAQLPTAGLPTQKRPTSPPRSDSADAPPTDIPAPARRSAPPESQDAPISRPSPTPSTPPTIPSPTAPTPTPTPPAALPPSDPTTLLTEADDARKTGDNARAVALLEQFLTRAADHERAPLAAFTLGRLEADVLGHPARAVLAFERALPRLPTMLAADALARLASARAAAGDAAGARSAARRYLEEHPDGSRAPAMRSLLERDR